MNLLQRRRAMMSQSGENYVLLEDVPNGSSVKLASGGANYIKMANVTGASLILKEILIGKQTPWSDSTHYADYEGCGIDTYLTTTFYNSIPSEARNNMVDYSLSMTAYDSSGKITKTLTRKVFIPVKLWLDDSGIFTTALKTFYNVTNANTARLAHTSSSTSGAVYQTCTAYDSTHFWNISATGTQISGAVNTSRNVRPCLAFSRTTKFKLVDGVYYLA